MKRFWLVIQAPNSRQDRSVSKTPGHMYETKKDAEDRAKEIAAKNGWDMLVLEVVSGFGPATPPVKRITITK